MYALQVSLLFAEWYRICEHPSANDTAPAHFIVQLHQRGLLKGDDMTDRFFSLLMVAFLSSWRLLFHTFGQDFQFD
jgi:CCR4-NOT transcription complex subunit 1